MFWVAYREDEIETARACGIRVERLARLELRRAAHKLRAHHSLFFDRDERATRREPAHHRAQQMAQ